MSSPAKTADSSRQLDGGQVKNEYLKYALWLTVEGQPLLLGRIWVTSSQMTEQGPTLGGVSMQAKTEYWAFVSATLPALSNHDGSKLVVEFDGAGSEDVGLDAGMGYYTAHEATLWREGAAQGWPSTTHVFDGGTDPLLGIGFELFDGAPSKWWWVQSGREDLRPADLDGQVLEETSNPDFPDLSYAAASGFTPFTPQG